MLFPIFKIFIGHKQMVFTTLMQLLRLLFPGGQSTNRKIENTYYELVWCQNADQILFDSRYDGIFPLITNLKDDAASILNSYKFQPRLEKRFEQLKSVYDIAPVFLQNTGRIEGLLFLYSAAILVTALRKSANVSFLQQTKCLNYFQMCVCNILS